MAKKVKTPEEVQAAMEKKVAKRTIFFGTFRKAFAFFLAIAFTFAMVQIAFTARSGGVVTTGGNANASEGSVQSADAPSESVDNAGDDDNGTAAEGEKPTEAKGDEISKADAVKLINEATAAAAKAGYDWTRKCYYTNDGAISVKTNGGKDATDTLNKAIHIADKNASVDTVVGGFLDITGKDSPLGAKKPKGSAAAPEGMKDKFLLKGMSLTEGDIARCEQSGNVYKFQLNACENPQKDGGNALSRATNDFVTQEEVVKRIGEEVPETVIGIESSSIQFKDIVIVAEISDGKLKSLTINYLMDVTSLNLKVLRITNVVGTGKGQVEETYKNFVY